MFKLKKTKKIRLLTEKEVSSDKYLSVSVNRFALLNFDKVSVGTWGTLDSLRIFLEHHPNYSRGYEIVELPRKEWTE